MDAPSAELEQLPSLDDHVTSALLGKSRSLSDPPTAPSGLAPSPNFREDLRRSSKDDYAIPTTPKASARTTMLNHGLSLQMPAREMSGLAHYERAAPLSPQLDSNNIYSVVQSQSQAASPVTSLPRHSRGLDFSRVSTNLHHSTLAEQSSPDLSPIITQKGLHIPQRRMSVSSMALDSPYVSHGSSGWALAHEKSAISSSLGSANMMASDSDSESSEDDASMGYEDVEDQVLTTPSVQKLHNLSVTTPLSNSITFSGPIWNTANIQSPATSSLLRTIRKSRLNKPSRRVKKSSSSATSNSGYSSLASPRTTSPPPLKSIENSGAGYFGGLKSRRESLALGTDGLHLSSGNDSGDEAGASPSTPGVVRRPVTRRGNLLPKTKGFARIRAALADEASPVDGESRREAETIRQVRERDTTVADLDLATPGSATEPSSPAYLSAVCEGPSEDFASELDLEATPMSKGLGVNFQLHGNRNSAFWNRNDMTSGSTPPPSFPSSFSRQSSTMNSETTMDSPIASSSSDMFQRVRGRAQSTASDMSDAITLQGPHLQSASTMNDDMHLKKFKRRRDDDSDISSVKRRAVSPGMSTQNSPILTQSPYSRDGTWGLPPERKKEREITSASSDASNASQYVGRSGSTGSVTGSHGNHGKKLGLQGMVDTNQGLMKMSIE